MIKPVLNWCAGPKPVNRRAMARRRKAQTMTSNGGYRMPPEWHAQDLLWIGFPHLADEWSGVIERAQEQIAAFASAVAATGQAVHLIVRDAANAARAGRLVSDKVVLDTRVYGDVWLRDTGPLVVAGGHGARLARLFGFNGWGNKYLMPGDQAIGGDLAAGAGLAATRADWVLEGGALDGDGTGLVATTEQCLLNPNRNPHLSRADLEMRLARDLGFTRVLWLGDGLINDHTDGHVDNLARFVAANRLAVPRATGADDPNAAIYADAAARARDFGVDVIEVPSPGRIEWQGMVQPASYMNFVVTTHAVIVPIFGSAHDADGVAAIAALFPGRETIGLMADAVLIGGGGFHCSSQQVPSVQPGGAEPAG
jgi:agmatine deiminase